LRRCLLAVQLGLGQIDVARDGRVADDGHLELGERERLDGLLARHHAIDELFLGLDPSVRVAVADLRGRDLIEPGLVGLEKAAPRRWTCLGAPRRGRGGRAGWENPPQQKPGGGEHVPPLTRHFTTRDVHGCSPLSQACIMACARASKSGSFLPMSPSREASPPSWLRLSLPRGLLSRASERLAWRGSA